MNFIRIKINKFVKQYSLAVPPVRKYKTCLLEFPPWSLRCPASGQGDLEGRSSSLSLARDSRRRPVCLRYHLLQSLWGRSLSSAPRPLHCNNQVIKYCASSVRRIKIDPFVYAVVKVRRIGPRILFNIDPGLHATHRRSGSLRNTGGRGTLNSFGGA